MANFDDLLVLAQNYQGGGIADTVTRAGLFDADWMRARSMVPEPALAAAMLGVTCLRRRR